MRWRGRGNWYEEFGTGEDFDSPQRRKDAEESAEKTKPRFTCLLTPRATVETRSLLRACCFLCASLCVSASLRGNGFSRSAARRAYWRMRVPRIGAWRHAS